MIEITGVKVLISYKKDDKEFIDVPLEKFLKEPLKIREDYPEFIKRFLSIHSFEPTDLSRAIVILLNPVKGIIKKISFLNDIYTFFERKAAFVNKETPLGVLEDIEFSLLENRRSIKETSISELVNIIENIKN